MRLFIFASLALGSKVPVITWLRGSKTCPVNSFPCIAETSGSLSSTIRYDITYASIFTPPSSRGTSHLTEATVLLWNVIVGIPGTFDGAERGNVIVALDKTL